MQSRLIDSLLAQLDAATDKVAWSKAVCRAAGHMARDGCTDEALRSMQAVKARFGTSVHPEVNAWLLLAEGLLRYSKTDVPAAYNCMQRSHALALAQRIDDLLPTTAGWLAVMELNTGQFERMVEHIRMALTKSAPDDHQAQARGALALGTAIQMAGDFQRARKWYEKARWHASVEGDRTTIGSLMFNAAILRYAAIRLDDALERVSREEIEVASVEAEGSRSFDQVTGNSALSSWGDLMHAQGLVLENRFEEALELLRKIDTQVNLDRKTTPLALTDQAWCHAMLGQLEEARLSALQAEVLIDEVPDSDEVVYMLARLAKIARLGGDSTLAEALNVRLESAIAAYEARQQKWLLGLSALEAELPKP